MEGDLSLHKLQLPRQIELSHQDSADRFLAATTMELELTLVTVDSRLVELN